MGNRKKKEKKQVEDGAKQGDHCFLYQWPPRFIQVTNQDVVGVISFQFQKKII
jgi:hypothetical protein